MVFSRKRFERSQFRLLPFGAKYLLASNLAAAPSIKYDRRNLIGGWSSSSGKLTLTAVADTSVAVVKIPRVFTAPAR